jgi:16S rRNA (cytosine967-C5)-methyltransferase
VLQKVEAGGFASDLLLSHLAGLDSRDAGLASEMVFGCLRRQMQLDYVLAQTSGRSVDKMDAAVRAALRLGAYQLRHLDRVPAHAAVGESVQLVKRARKSSAAGLVNAVLRKLPREAIAWPAREIAWSVPEWLLASWETEFGPETTERIAEAFLKPPETFVRNPTSDRPGLALEPSDVPGAYKVLAGDVTGLRIQDVSSQSIVPLLELEPGMSFLDLCSAPGNKTAQALETPVEGIACDLHLHRLRNVSGCARVALDATKPLPFGRRFDRILVDAPCSGTGTLSRNPEIRWRLRSDDIEMLHRKQVQILTNALELIAPGGRLVYSTCSLERPENEDVVSSMGGVRVLEMRRRIPGVDEGDGFFAALMEI